MKRILAFSDAVVVLALFLGVRLALKNTGFGDWQDPIFGRALLSSTFLFFILPLLYVFVRGQHPGITGLTTARLGAHFRVAIRAAMFVAPATVMFPIIAMIGSDHKEWLGASMLALAFLLGGFLFARNSQDLVVKNTTGASWAGISWTGISLYVALLAAGLLASYQLNMLSQIATRLVAAFIFVGFLEEFLFRGYVQSRFNDCFGRPWKFFGVEFGAGLFFTAALFGLFHPITVANATPWPWGLWTAAAGLVFGFLREKTGSIIAPALLHGIIWVPGVLFGPAAG